MTGQTYAIAFIVLIIYSAWMTWNWIKSKGDAQYYAGENEMKSSQIAEMRKQWEKERQSFEERLVAKQHAVGELKRKLLLNVRPSPAGLGDLLFDGVPEDDTDPDADS